MEQEAIVQSEKNQTETMILLIYDPLTDKQESW